MTLSERLDQAAQRPGLPANVAALLSEAKGALNRQSADLVDADQAWIEGLEEGDEIELIIRARVSDPAEGRFTAPKTTHWRDLGTNYYSRTKE